MSNKRAPASVGARLRVVRFSRRMPSRLSSRLTVWLSADWVLPSRAAAWVKLPAWTTAAKAAIAPSSAISIDEALSPFFMEPLCRFLLDS
ncbi:hypothetical protein D3C85_1640070 [compost metagenome]